MKTNFFFLSLIFTIAISSCYSQNHIPTKNTSLKKAFKNSFYIGTAINESQINEKNAAENKLIVSQFNSITPEDVMKSMYVHPQKDKYDFGLSDKYVSFGQKNNMFIVGHTLIWHSQMAPWMQDIKGSEEMKKFMEEHITTIVTRYKGKINSWDVVNEAINDDGTLRKSVFLDALGEDYLSCAFELASKADPKAELYYNDYSMETPAKRETVIRLIKGIKAKGIKVDGIGMQGHWQIDTPSIEEIEKSILDYSALGVKVAITEMDVSALPNPWAMKGAEISQRFENSPKMNPYPQNLPDSIQVKLAKRYEDIFKLLLKHKDKISRVTFWGINDGNSWLNDFPIKGRTNYPLLFDRQLEPKKAYFSVINTTKK